MDPEALELEVHKLSTITIVHKTRSPASLKALKQGNVAWEDVTIEQLAAQNQGDAFMTTIESSSVKWQNQAGPAASAPPAPCPAAPPGPAWPKTPEPKEGLGAALILTR